MERVCLSRGELSVVHSVDLAHRSVQNGQGTRIGRFNICQFRDEVTRFGIPLDETIAFFTRSHGDWRFIQVNDILPHVIKLQCDDDFVWARFQVTDLPGLFLHARECCRVVA